MRIIIAPQSLKGSLTAAEAGEAIAVGVRAVYAEAEPNIVPIADGGEGPVQALVDATGKELARGGAALATLARISMEKMDPRLQECTVDVACDVNNPLCGPSGASAVYGPQKGATPEMVAALDAALAHYADIIERDLGLK